MPLTREEICQLLHLDRHPTCGYVAETYRSSIHVPAASLPSEYGAPRPVGSALYFLVASEAPVKLHRIRSDQQYHHYLGDPLELLMLLADGTARVVTVGSDLRAGAIPQCFIPGGTFHTARLKPGGTLALLGSTEWPGVEPPDVEVGDREKLAKSNMTWRVAIDEFLEIADNASDRRASN